MIKWCYVARKEANFAVCLQVDRSNVGHLPQNLTNLQRLQHILWRKDKILYVLFMGK